MERINENFNYADIVENVSIAKLDGDYKGRLIELVKENFTHEEARLFLTSFFAFLNYDPYTEFVIDLTNVWKWCGFSRIDHAKRLLEKFFEKDVHYKISKRYFENLVPPKGGIKKGHGGDRKSEQILMTVNAFKKFCLKARTKQADKVHDYYIKLEEIVMMLFCEQNERLAKELLLKDENNEKILITNSHKTPLVYIGLIEDNIVKFGYSKNIKLRVETHKRYFPSFVLKYTIHSKNYIALEDEIKESCQMKDSLLYGRRITKEYDGKLQTELIQLDSSFTIDDFQKEIEKMDKILENRKSLGDNATIMKLRADLRTANDEIKELKRELKEALNNNDSVIKSSKKIKKDTSKKSQRYIYEFLENLYYNNVDKNREIIIENENLYKLYVEFVSTKYDLMYVLGDKKLMCDISECENVKPARVTLPKDHPEYVKGKDNRKKGHKRIVFNNYFKNWISKKLN